MANVSLLNKIKSYFVFGAQPTEAQFSEFIEASADASFINRGVIDNQHLPTALDLTHKPTSSVTAGQFIGDGHYLTNLDAEQLLQGTVANARLPSHINLTNAERDSSIRADDMLMATVSVTDTLTVDHEARVTGNMTVSGMTSLEEVQVSHDLTVAGVIASQTHNIQLGMGPRDSETPHVSLQTQLVDDSILDILSFDSQAETVTIAVKNDAGYGQDEVAGKHWVDHQVSSAVDNVTVAFEQVISAGITPQLESVSGTIKNEVNRAKRAEQQVQSNVDALSESLSDELQNEVVRAQSAEQQVQHNLDTLSTSLSDDLKQEMSRAQNVEQQLQNNVDALAASSTKALQAEAKRAKAAEKKLQTNVDTLSASSSTLSSELQQEADRAQGAEQQLQNNVDALAASSTKALQAEAKRAKAAEKKLQTNVDTLSASSSTLSSELQQEVDRAQAAEQKQQKSLEDKALALEADIKTEKGRVDGLLTTTANYQDSQDKLVSRVDSLATSVNEQDNTQQYLDGRVEGSLAIGKSLVPSAGNSAESGINFPGDPGGGSSDRAWIRYYPQQGESTLFEIGTTNDTDDHIVLIGTGNVGVGTRAPTAKFHVAGSALAQACNIASDVRLKSNIKEITNPLNKLWSIRGVYFDWQDQALQSHQGQQMGVIAQEVEAVFPQLVNTDKAGLKSVDYSKLVAPLIEAVKELSEQVDHQAHQIEALKDLIAYRD